PRRRSRPITTASPPLWHTWRSPTQGLHGSRAARMPPRPVSLFRRTRVGTPLHAAGPRRTFEVQHADAALRPGSSARHVQEGRDELPEGGWFVSFIDGIFDKATDFVRDVFNIGDDEPKKAVAKPERSKDLAI